MENKQIIDLAYELARTKYRNKAFTFLQLWKELIKKCKLDEQEQKDAGHVYTQMLQDHRFIFAGNSEFKVREFLKLEDQNSLSNAIYDFQQAEEEGDDAEAAKKKLRDAKAKEEIYYDDDDLETMSKESELALEDEDEDDEDEQDNESETPESEDEEEEE